MLLYQGDFVNINSFLESLSPISIENSGYIYIFNLICAPNRIKLGYSQVISNRLNQHAANAKCYADTKLNNILVIGQVENVTEIENKLKIYAKNNLTAISDEWFNGDINILFNSPIIKGLQYYIPLQNFSQCHKDISKTIKLLCNQRGVDYIKMTDKNLKKAINSILNTTYSIQTITNELFTMSQQNKPKEVIFDSKYGQWILFDKLDCN